MTGSLRQPPRFVPTLTEVVAPRVISEVQADEQAPRPIAPPVRKPDALPVQELRSTADLAVEKDWPAMAEHLQAQVVASLEPQLQARLEAVVRETVQMHTALLHKALEGALREAVSLAVQDAVRKALPDDSKLR